MNEAQEKPKIKWYKKWQFIIVVILLIAAIGYVLALSLQGQIGTCPPPSYEGIKANIQNAVAAFWSDNQGSALPILSDTYTNANCSNCNVINMSALLIENGGILKDIPDGTWQGPGTTDDNCDSSAAHISGCSTSNHYVWLVDTDGRVYSYCMGDDCTANNSGYQDIWP